jgi:hypothetical protein
VCGEGGMGLISNIMPIRDIWSNFPRFLQNQISLASLGKFCDFVKKLGKFIPNIPHSHDITITNFKELVDYQVNNKTNIQEHITFVERNT